MNLAETGLPNQPELCGSVPGEFLTLNNTADVRITGAGGISGDLTKSGGSTLRLSHAGGFDGTLTVANQFVVLGSASTEPTTQTSSNTKVVINTGTGLILGSAYNGGSATIGELSGAGAVRTDWAEGGTNATRTLIVHQASNSVFSGTFIQGSGRALGLEKAGSGTLDLSNNAALSVPQGGVTISGGILRISGNTGDAAPLNATGTLSIASGATLDLANTANAGPAGVSRTLTGAGTIKRSGSGNLVINGTNNAGFTGEWLVTGGNLGFASEAAIGGSAGVTLNGGGLYFTANGVGVSSAKTITLGENGGFFDGSTGWTQTWSAKITGDGNLVKRSGMTLVLDGADNDYTGSTVINTGTLKLGSANAIASSPLIIVGASTTLDVLDVSWTLGSGQTLVGAGTIAGNAVIDGAIARGGSATSLTVTGTLGLTEASEWRVGIGGTATGSFDRLFVDGQLTAAGTIAIALTDGFVPTSGDSFKIATFGGFDDDGYGFDLSAAALAPGFTWDTSSFADNGTIMVIPEPAAAFLGGLGLLLMLRRRR